MNRTLKAAVEIEESQLGKNRWAVIILRPGASIPRTLWGRYATQAEAQEGAKEARTYLDQNPSLA